MRIRDPGCNQRKRWVAKGGWGVGVGGLSDLGLGEDLMEHLAQLVVDRLARRRRVVLQQPQHLHLRPAPPGRAGPQILDEPQPILKIDTEEPGAG